MTTFNDLVDRTTRMVFGLLETLPKADKTSKLDLYTNMFLAGGMFHSLTIDHKSVNDYDVFFSDPAFAKKFIDNILGYYGVKLRVEFVEDETTPGLFISSFRATDKNSTVEAVIEHYNNLRKGANKKSKDPKELLFISNNALNMGCKLQLIFKFVGKPDRVFETFDFEHCKVFSKPLPVGLRFSYAEFCGRSLESFSKNELIYTPQSSRYCLSALARVCKFVNRGWKVAPATLLGIVDDVSKLDLSSKAVLSDQLQSFYGLPYDVTREILALAEEDNKINFSKVVKLLEGY